MPGKRHRQRSTSCEGYANVKRVRPFAEPPCKDHTDVLAEICHHSRAISVGPAPGTREARHVRRFQSQSQNRSLAAREGGVRPRDGGRPTRVANGHAQLAHDVPPGLRHDHQGPHRARALPRHQRVRGRALCHASLNSHFSTNVKNLVDDATVRGLLRVPAAHGARRRRNRRRVRAAGNRARHRARLPRAARRVLGVLVAAAASRVALVSFAKRRHVRQNGSLL